MGIYMYYINSQTEFVFLNQGRVRVRQHVFCALQFAGPCVDTHFVAPVLKLSSGRGGSEVSEYALVPTW